MGASYLVPEDVLDSVLGELWALRLFDVAFWRTRGCLASPGKEVGLLRRHDLTSEERVESN